jgi:hypothetical protein
MTPELLLSVLASLHDLEDDFAGRVPADVCAEARVALMRRLADARLAAEGLRPVAVAVSALVGTSELQDALEAIRTRGGDWYFEASPHLALDDGRGGVFVYDHRTGRTGSRARVA